MKIQKCILMAMSLLLLASCGPAVIVPIQTPNMQATTSPTLPALTAYVVLPTGIAKPSEWDLCDASPINCIRSIAIDDDGNLWAVTKFGVVYWDLVTEKFVYAELIDHVVFNANQDTMNSIVVAGDNTIVAASFHGKIFSFRNGKWIQEIGTERFATHMSLTVQPDGSVWASALFFRGVYRYSDGNWTHEDILSQFTCGITYVTSNTTGTVWAVDDGCPKSRAYLRMYDNGEWKQVGDYSPGQMVFNGETIWFADFHNNEDRVCKIGTDGNIECFIFPEKRMWYTGVLFGKKDEVWIRSSGDDVWHLDHGMWDELNYPTMAGDYVLSMYIPPDGVMFIGTSGQGIVRFDGKTVKRYFVNYIPGE
jgi:streptogramin lyase